MKFPVGHFQLGCTRISFTLRSLSSGWMAMFHTVMNAIGEESGSVSIWELAFNPNWIWAQPLLFHEEPDTARTVELLQSVED